MNIAIVIPVYNEERYLPKMLQSIVEQTYIPSKVVVVNDNSTDDTQKIIDSFSSTYSFITSVMVSSEGKHEPGSKIVNAFYQGFGTIGNDFDIICKYDADLIFPKNYLEKIKSLFEKDMTCGIAGGFCYIQEGNNWNLENLTNKDHVRGALKAYRRECFDAIGGLKKSIGWDTVDELLAQYHGWKVKTDQSLHVKHLKPTGKVYAKSAKYKQGEAFYKMRYGFVLTNIAAAKLAFKKKDLGFYLDCLNGFRQAKRQEISFIIAEEEGRFVRKLRWKNIKKKFL